MTDKGVAGAEESPAGLRHQALTSPFVAWAGPSADLRLGSAGPFQAPAAESRRLLRLRLILQAAPPLQLLQERRPAGRRGTRPAPAAALRTRGAGSPRASTRTALPWRRPGPRRAGSRRRSSGRAVRVPGGAFTQAVVASAVQSISRGMASAGKASSRARAWAAFARTWTSGSRRASTRAGMTSSGMAAAFIHPAEATLRMSPLASWRPAANACRLSAAGSWRSPAWPVRARPLPRSGRRGARAPPPPRPRGRACPGPGRRGPGPRGCRLPATAGTGRRSPPAWPPASFGSTLVTSTFTWSFASSRRGIRPLQAASPGSPHWPTDSTAAARTRGSASCNPARTTCSEAGVGRPIAPRARMAWLRTPPSSSRAAVRAPRRGGRGRPHLAERLGGVAAHLGVEVPQGADQGGNGLVGRLAHLAQGFRRQGADPVVLVPQRPHQAGHRDLRRRFADLPQGLHGLGPHPVVAVPTASTRAGAASSPPCRWSPGPRPSGRAPRCPGWSGPSTRASVAASFKGRPGRWPRPPPCGPTPPGPARGGRAPGPRGRPPSSAPPAAPPTP